MGWGNCTASVRKLALVTSVPTFSWRRNSPNRVQPGLAKKRPSNATVRRSVSIGTDARLCPNGAHSGSAARRDPAGRQTQVRATGLNGVTAVS